MIYRKEWLKRSPPCFWVNKLMVYGILV